MKYYVNDFVFDQLKMNAYHQDFSCKFAVVQPFPTQTKVINSPKLFFCQKDNHFFGRLRTSKNTNPKESVKISTNYLSTFMNFNTLLTGIHSKSLRSLIIEGKEHFIDYFQDETLIISKNIIFSTNYNTVSISFLFDDYSIEIHNYHNWIHIRKVFLLQEASFKPEIIKKSQEI